MTVKIKYDITEDQIKVIHALIVNAFSGIYDSRSSSALTKVMELYNSCNNNQMPTIAKAIALLYGIIRFHPFLDANKRTALLAASTFLLMNGYTLELDEKKTLKLLDNIEKGEVSREEIKEYLHVHIIPCSQDNVI